MADGGCAALAIPFTDVADSIQVIAGDERGRAAVRQRRRALVERPSA